MKISKLQVLLMIIVVIATVVSIIGILYQNPFLNYTFYIAIIAMFISIFNRRKK